MSGRWLLHDHAILRSTGFPWRLLAALDWPQTNAALDELERAESALSTAVSRVVATARAEPDAVSPRQSRKLRKALSRRTGVAPDLLTDVESAPLLAALERYRLRLEAVHRARRTAERRADEEAGRSHRAIMKAADDPAVREALWLSSPSMHDHGLGELSALAADPLRGRARRLRRQFGGYLQRFAAKNETTSFFGPINYAEFGLEPDGSEPLTSEPALRSTLLAYWAVVALADAVAADPDVRPHLRPRTSGLLSPADPRTTGGRPLNLPQGTRELLRAADGRRTVQELAGLLGTAADDLLRTAEQAAANGLLHLDCRPPVTVTDALGWLRAQVAALPAGHGWLVPLDRIRARLDEFAAAGLGRRRELLAELEREIAEFADGPVRRGGGEWYADRLVLHEEALGSCTPLALGRSLQDRLLGRLSPALDLLAAEGIAQHAALTERFLACHPELAQNVTVPLLTLLRSDREPELVPEGPLTPAGRQLAKLAEEAPPGRPLRVDPADLDLDLDRDLDPGLRGPGPGAGPLIASPDLMFPATGLAGVLAGAGDVVLAECHDTMLIWGWAVQFHPRRGQVERAGAELLRRACGSTPMAIVLGSRRAKIVPFDFPGAVVDLGSTVPADDRPRLPIAEVGVRLSGGRLVCTAPGRPDFLLHHGELDSPVHNVLAPPRVRPVTFGQGRRMPRVVLGGVVIARARWELDRGDLFPPGDDMPGELSMLRYAREAAEAHGIPQRTFLKVPGERKPVLLDLRAPVLLDLGRHLSARAHQIVLTELLPGPEELWLRGRDGRHCAELRTTVVLDRRADGGDGG